MVGAETDPRSKIREEQHRLRQATAAKKERLRELHWRKSQQRGSRSEACSGRE